MAKQKKRPDGRIEIVRTIKGKKRHFYGKTRAEADQKYIAELTRAEKGVLFSEAADAWHGEFIERCAHNSRSGYDPALRRLIDAFGDRYVSEITAKELQIFVDGLARRGYAKKTIQTHLIVASNIFKRARVEYGTENNPAAFVSAPSDAPQETRELPSDKDDALVMANAAAGNYGLFLLIAKYTGARRGEILALRYGDIDREQMTVRIERSVYHVGNAPHIKQPKTKAGIRTVPLLDVLAAMIPQGKPEQYIFGGAEPLTNSRLRDLEEAFREQTGITATAHQFRHLYATMLFDAEITAKDAQKLLGHAQFQTTMDIYTHVRDQRTEKARNKLNKFVKRSSESTETA